MSDEYDNDYEPDFDMSEGDEEVGDIEEEGDMNLLTENEQKKINITTFEDILKKMNGRKKQTIPILTKFERARIIGVREQQLALGAKPRINTDGLKNIEEICKKELIERKIPFIIRRTLPNGTFEDWKLSDFQQVI